MFFYERNLLKSGTFFPVGGLVVSGFPVGGLVASGGSGIKNSWIVGNMPFGLAGISSLAVPRSFP